LNRYIREARNVSGRICSGPEEYTVYTGAVTDPVDDGNGYGTLLDWGDDNIGTPGNAKNE